MFISMFTLCPFIVVIFISVWDTAAEQVILKLSDNNCIFKGNLVKGNGHTFNSSFQLNLIYLSKICTVNACKKSKLICASIIEFKQIRINGYSVVQLLVHGPHSSYRIDPGLDMQTPYSDRVFSRALIHH